MNKSLPYLLNLYDRDPLEQTSHTLSETDAQEMEVFRELKARLETRPQPSISANILATVMQNAQHATNEAAEGNAMLQALYGEATATDSMRASAMYRNLEATKQHLESRASMQPRVDVMARILAEAKAQTPKETASATSKLVPIRWLQRPTVRWAMAACVALLAVMSFLRMETNVFQSNIAQAEAIEIYAPSKRIFSWNDRDALTNIYDHVADLDAQVQSNSWGERGMPEVRIVVPTLSTMPEAQTVKTDD